MKDYLDYCDTQPTLLASSIKFESNGLNNRDAVRDICDRLTALGYVVRREKTDVYATKS